MATACNIWRDNLLSAGSEIIPSLISDWPYPTPNHSGGQHEQQNHSFLPLLRGKNGKDRAGRLEIGRLLVQILAPPLLCVQAFLSKILNPEFTSWWAAGTLHGGLCHQRMKVKSFVSRFGQKNPALNVDVLTGKGFGGGESSLPVRYREYWHMCDQRMRAHMLHSAPLIRLLGQRAMLLPHKGYTCSIKPNVLAFFNATVTTPTESSARAELYRL